MKRRLALLLTFTVIILSTCILPASAAANVYRKKDTAQKKIALTFDDGPHPRLTPKILSILEKYNIKATFFVIGQNVEYYPDAMKRIAESGCEVGNHTYTHRNLDSMNTVGIESEIQRTESALLDGYGIRPRLLRPPRGMYREELMDIARRSDFDIILWSIDTRDWEHTPAAAIAENILSSAEDGDIILMHDYIGGYSPTCEALEMFIPELLRRGYEFVTVSELIDG